MVAHVASAPLAAYQMPGECISAALLARIWRLFHFPATAKFSKGERVEGGREGRKGLTLQTAAGDVEYKGAECWVWLQWPRLQWSFGGGCKKDKLCIFKKSNVKEFQE